jgi:hypothetical protein
MVSKIEYTHYWPFLAYIQTVFSPQYSATFNISTGFGKKKLNEIHSESKIGKTNKA